MSARYYGRIFASEQDRVNCPFYQKIGACRHGDRCSRQHHRPQFSTTLIIPHMYEAPKGPDGQPDQRMEPFEEFLIEVIDEMKKYGEVQDIVVLQNMGDHLYGNTYIQFADEAQCAEALKHTDKRFFAGRPLTAEFSPVTDFKDVSSFIKHKELIIPCRHVVVNSMKEHALVMASATSCTHFLTAKMYDWR